MKKRSKRIQNPSIEYPKTYDFGRGVAVDLDYFSYGATGLTGAIKITTAPKESDCCGSCQGGDDSVIVIYDNGSPIDLWECQGCKCQQKPVNAIDVPVNAKALIVSGAVVPEEVCSRCCYSRSLADTSELSLAWDLGRSIKGEAMDLVAEGIKLAMAQKELTQLKKQLEKKVVVLPVLPDATLDPFARYIESLSQC